jgi:hypothetical protein
VCRRPKGRSVKSWPTVACLRQTIDFDANIEANRCSRRPMGVSAAAQPGAKVFVFSTWNFVGVIGPSFCCDHDSPYMWDGVTLLTHGSLLKPT